MNETVGDEVEVGGDENVLLSIDSLGERENEVVSVSESIGEELWLPRDDVVSRPRRD